MKEKKEEKICLPRNEYRRLKRKEQQLLTAKNHIRTAWQAINRIKEDK